MPRYHRTSKTSRGARRPSASRVLHLVLALGRCPWGRYNACFELLQRSHGAFDLAAASRAARPLVAALAFGVSSAGSGKVDETLGAGDLSPVTAFGRVASQSSRA